MWHPIAPRLCFVGWVVYIGFLLHFLIDIVPKTPACYNLNLIGSYAGPIVLSQHLKITLIESCVKFVQKHHLSMAKIDNYEAKCNLPEFYWLLLRWP